MRTALRRMLVLALLAGAWALACANETGGGTGGGAAAAVACVRAEDCRGVVNACRRPSCKAGRCALEDAPAGTPTADQVAGDCKRSVCDGKGNAVLVEDDTDVPGDHAQCIVGTCDGGVPAVTPSMPGTACIADGGRVCDGMGVCIECIEAAECDGGSCVDNHCAP